MIKPSVPRTKTGGDSVARLEGALRGFRGDLTIADAATKSGLALREAEAALTALVARYQGHLGVTDSGELVFRFPDGLRPPPEKRLLRRFARMLKNGLLGIGRFLVRAWVTVVVVAYALIFGAVLIAIATRSDDDNGAGKALAIVGRLMFEALYWTFHPFSPFYLGDTRGFGKRRGRKPTVPFYERVNRFVFGPQPPPADPMAVRQTLLAEIRRLGGRIGMSDVLRVTGLGRGEADALVSTLLIDFQGEVEVSEEGAIIYVFKDLRATAQGGEASADHGDGEAVLAETETTRPARPFFADRKELLPVTGNPASSNLLFGALNAFNLVSSGYVLANGLTFERIAFLLGQAAHEAAGGVPLAPPPEGVPIALGLVPFVFSSMLFLLPVVRLIRRPAARRKVEAENGMRALAALVLGSETDVARLPATRVEATFKDGAGRAATPRELVDAVRRLGGTFEIGEDGQHEYHFTELVRERAALAAARKAAPRAELGTRKLVFSSDS